jgi:tripartite-type tricarboxylate transporter receptor subunit TctC
MILNPRRRKFLHLAAGAATLPFLPRSARALDYPTRSIHFVTGYPAGTAPDIFARLLAQALSDRLGQQVIVENRPGATNNIGTEYVAHAPPDGYTLLLTLSTNAINQTLYPNLNFDFSRDFVSVAGFASTAFVFVVNPDFPAKSLPDLITYGKANPGKVNLATNGIGTGAQVAAVMFMMMTNAPMTVVPYKGNYFPDLLAGQVQVADPPMAGVAEYIKSGKLRALAVTTAQRSRALPDVPPVADFVPDFAAAGWFGVAAPKGTPPEIVEKLAATVVGVASDSAFQSRVIALGAEPMPMTSAQFGKFVADETEKWGRVVKSANIRVE